MDLTSLAKSLPGAMICNVAMLYGYRAGGLLGGLLCVLGVLVSLSLSTYIGGGSLRLPSITIGIVDLVLLMKYKVSIPKVLLFSVGMGLVFFGVLGI